MKRAIPFGKYYLVERINVGGMAEVFKAKAYGVEGFEKHVAIKRILPNIAEDEEFIKMFIDEAKISVQLNHAHIAQIYDLGKIDNSYFIAMEFVNGRDLRGIFDRLRKKGEIMAVAMACFVIIKACEGLDYAHRKKDPNGRDLNIVHRDVSPQNVLVSYDGEVKLIDFGIAKAANKASKTEAGILKGKFGYMSPEQVRGLPLDRRSDIFSLGIVLYELLTGERLFVGESDFSTLEKVRNVEIVPPSTYNRRIPDVLERIVMKALSKDVEDRYQYAAEMAEDLQRFLLISSTQSFTAKDLAGYMRAMFAEEIAKAAAKAEQEAALLPPPSSPSDSAMPAVATEPTMETGPIAPDGGRSLAPTSSLPRPSPAREGRTSPELQLSEGGTHKMRAAKAVGDGAVRPGPVGVSPVAARRAAARQPPPTPVQSAERRAFRLERPSLASRGATFPISVPRRSVAFMRKAAIAAGAVVVVLAVVLWLKLGPESDGTTPAFGEVSIIVAPPDADIFWDGRLMAAKAPWKRSGLRAGTHQLIVRREGYREYRQEVTIAPDKTENVVVTMRPALEGYGFLEIETRPPGAVITVDGLTRMNPTPDKIQVPAEVEVAVLLSKSGYKNWTSKLKVGRDKVRKVEVKLQSTSMNLSVGTDSPGAAVFLDGRKRGTTPLRITDLECGPSHSIRIKAAGYRAFQETFEFTEKECQDGEANRQYALVREKGESGSPASPKEGPAAGKGGPKPQPEDAGFGYLDLNSRPWAHVWIDGKDINRTTPLFNYRLPAGEHAIQLVNKNFDFDRTFKIKIKSGQKSLHIEKQEK